MNIDKIIMNHFVLGSSGKEDSLWMALEKVYSD